MTIEHCLPASRWAALRSSWRAGIDPSRVEKELRPYDELIERRERLTSALAALDTPSGQPTKKRVRLHEVAAYVAQHPGVMPAEAAAALEVPRPNIQAHFVRNEGTVFEKGPGGWHTIPGWETAQEAQR